MNFVGALLLLRRRYPLRKSCGTHFARHHRGIQGDGGDVVARSLGSDDLRHRRFVSSLVSWEIADDDDDDDEEKKKKKTTTKVGIITLRSARTRNALTVEMGRGFESLASRLGRELTDPDHPNGSIGAIVLRGEGDEAFSAGGDLRWLRSLSDRSVHANVDAMLAFYRSFLCLRELVPVPVVAALQGPAVGAGACLALACDLRVGASGDVPLLGFPFCRLGIPPGMGALHLLTKCGRLGEAEAAEILLLGKTLTGEEARSLGLVNRLVPRHRVREEATSLASEIARTSHPVAVRSLIRSLRSGSDDGGGGGGSLSECLHRDAHAQAACYDRKDWGEGLEAVTSRRDPDFDGYHSR